MKAPSAPAAVLAASGVEELAPAVAALEAIARAVLVPVVRAAVRLELEERRAADADPLVDVAEGLPLSRRTAYALAREGKIPGARKLGKRWVAHRSELDRFVADQAPRRVKASAPRVAEPWSPELARQRAGIRTSGGAR